MALGDADSAAPDDTPGRIRELRTVLGLSQEQLARQLGVSFATVNRWETGRNRISARMNATLENLSLESLTVANPERGPGAAVEATGRPAGLASYSTFVGRERELAELTALLAAHRLVCIVGPGGSGKSRLAAELARRLTPTLPATVVALESLRGPRLVTTAIAAALGVRDRPEAPGSASLVAALDGEPRLLVLDAAEHVEDDVAAVVATLLDGAPALRVLVTSRRVLGAPSELSWAVPPLTYPPPGAGANDTASWDAVQLFVTRAREHLPGFDLDAVDASVVGELCRRLGGSPLAIELITGWMGTLSVDEILERRAALLGGRTGARTTAGALRDVVEASYDLLDDDERALLPALSVFVGGFTIDDACAATAIPVEALVHVVRGLVDASWLQVRREGLHNRFVLLETTREFAAERLAHKGEEAAVSERHARHFAALAVDSEEGLTTADAVQWRTRMTAAWPDVEAALAWAETTGEIELGLSASSALWRWWLTSGRLVEGRGWLARFIAANPGAQSLSVGRALSSAAILATENGDYRSAVVQAGAALRIFDAIDESEAAATAATAAGSAHRYLGEHAEARRYLERAMQLRRDVGDARGVSVGLNNLALLALDEGDLPRAGDLFEESLLIKRQLGEPRAVALGLANLSEVLIRGRQVDRASWAIDEGLTLAHQLADRQLIGTLRCNQGEVDGHRGDWVSAATHYAEAVDAHRAAGHHHDVVVALIGHGRALHQLGRTAAAVKQLRDAEALAANIANATHLASVRAALAEVGERSVALPPAGITAREAEILGHLGRGLTNKAIAAELHLSVATVERHLATIYRKLTLRGRVDAARYAVANGLAPAPR